MRARHSQPRLPMQSRERRRKINSRKLVALARTAIGPPTAAPSTAAKLRERSSGIPPCPSWPVLGRHVWQLLILQYSPLQKRPPWPRSVTIIHFPFKSNLFSIRAPVCLFIYTPHLMINASKSRRRRLLRHSLRDASGILRLLPRCTPSARWSLLRVDRQSQGANWSQTQPYPRRRGMKAIASQCVARDY